MYFFDSTTKSYLIDPSISIIIVDSQALDLDTLAAIKKINNKPILFLETSVDKKKIDYMIKFYYLLLYMI